MRLRSQAEAPPAGVARRAERRVLVVSRRVGVGAMPGTSTSAPKPRVRLAAAQGSGNRATRERCHRRDSRASAEEFAEHASPFGLPCLTSVRKVIK